MRLNIDDDLFVDDPTSLDLLNELNILSDDEFAILEHEEHVYIQALRSDDQWIVEYRDGGPAQHFKLESMMSSTKDVHHLFVAFLKGESLEHRAAWVPMTL